MAFGLGRVGGLFDTAEKEGGEERIRRLRFQSGAPDSPLGGGLLRSRFVGRILEFKSEGDKQSCD